MASNISGFARPARLPPAQRSRALRGSLLTGIKLRQDLLTDFVENLCRVARPVLEVEDHVVDTGRTQLVEEVE